MQPGGMEPLRTTKVSIAGLQGLLLVRAAVRWYAVIVSASPFVPG